MGTTSEKLTYLNTTKGLIKDKLNLGGANITTEPFRAYSSKLMGIYKDFLAHGTDELWNNWEKVTGTGETLTLNNTMEGKMKVDLKGNTYQNGEPTPSTPIPVQVVSGDNTIKVEGKNLFDSYLTTQTIGGVSVSYNIDGTITLNGTATSNQTAYAFTKYPNGQTAFTLQANQPYTTSLTEISGTATFGENTEHSSIQLWKKWNYAYQMFLNDMSDKKVSVTKTPTSEENINAVQISIRQNDIFNNYTIGIQVEKGSTSSSYTPYVSQTYPVNLGDIELCKIGTYQDRIVKDNGKWCLNKQIGKVVLNGSEGWFSASLWGNNSYAVSKSTINMNSPAWAFMYSKYFKTNPTQLAIQLNNEMVEGEGSLVINNSSTTTTADFKTWLSTHNTSVYYVLATPTNEEITDTTLLSQLNNLYNANSYEGTTNISQVNDDMPFILDLTALKEMA